MKKAARGGLFETRKIEGRLLGGDFGLLVGFAVTALGFGDTGRFAAQTAQIIKLGATNLAAAHDLDGIDHRPIERENALDALAVGNLANGEALVEAAAGPRNANAFI